MQIKISEIKINPGRRDTQQRNVEELARSIAAVGLMNPITVTQDNTLIAGLHRLEAVKLLGWTEIKQSWPRLTRTLFGLAYPTANWAICFCAGRNSMRPSTRRHGRA